MPANLTPAYREAEERFRQATTPEEKIECLEEMLAIIPKHKGTEKLQADLKRRLSKLRQESESGRGPARRDTAFRIDKEGAGQIALVGRRTCGKSSLLAALQSSTYWRLPFTANAYPGMMLLRERRISYRSPPSSRLPDPAPASPLGWPLSFADPASDDRMAQAF